MKFALLKFVQISLFLMAFGAHPAFAVMEDYPSVKLQGLDKSVGRTKTFEAKVGSTIQYGPLFVKIHACRKAPPIETPESAVFLQIWEVPPGQTESQWVFSGWMFASSPALSAMDHPVYDVWVLECTGRDEPVAEVTDNNDELQEDAAPQTAPTQEVIDSEAEDQSVEGATEQPAPDIIMDETAPAIQSQPVTNPTNDGFTAYDLMRQQNNQPQNPASIQPPSQ